MTRILNQLFSILLFSLLLNNTSLSQDWNWDWATTITAETKGSMMEAMHVDQYNNIYCRVPYSGPIFIGDTSFNYGDPGDYFANYAIAKYTDHGVFQYAINMRDGDVNYPEFVTDKHQNLFIAGDFRHHMWVNDSLIIMNPGSSGFHGEVFLYKLNPNNEVVWAGLISNQWDDQLTGLIAAPDQEALYISTEHYANGDPHILNYFNQDTSLPFNTPMNTLVKVDTSCNILWKKEVRSEYLGTSTRRVFTGQDDKLYLFGDGLAHFYVDEDTIYHPNVGSGGAVVKIWLLQFDHDGNLLNGFYFDWDIWFYELEIDLMGNIFLTGTIMDTAVIGQDTIIVPEGLYYRVTGKFNPDLQPYWYHIFEEQQNQNIYFRDLELDQDHLIIAGQADGDVQVGDTTYHFGNNFREVVIGEYNADGELVSFTASECDKDFTLWNMILDNCKNPILSGMFMGTGILGTDTLNSFDSNFDDGYMTKLLRNAPETLNLGNDTLVCEAITLQAPIGYPSYMWNNQPGGQNTFEATETGVYTVACGHGDGCWIYDTILVSVDQIEEINLGADTSILENDTLIIEVTGNYDWFIWSDGSFNSKIEVVGSEYGIGNHMIWVEAIKGACIKKDTLMLEVKSEFGLDESFTSMVRIYPNPFTHTFVVQTLKDTERISIFRLDGTLVQEIELNLNREKDFSFSLEGEQAGIYVIRIFTKHGIFAGKLIKR